MRTARTIDRPLPGMTIDMLADVSVAIVNRFAEDPRCQDILAKLLCEHGWTCTPPQPPAAEPAPRARKRRT